MNLIEKLSSEKLLKIEHNYNKRFYAANCLYYYSPFFDTEDLNNYSYHLLALIGEKPSSIEEYAIGNYIPPDEPYCLIENDIIIEFKNEKICGYIVKQNDKKLYLHKFCKNVDDNVFIANFVKIKFLPL